MKKTFTLDDAVVAVHASRVLVETAAAQGADRAALFADTGIRPELLEVPETRLTHAQLGMLIRNALRLTGNPALGLDAGRNTHRAALGVLGLSPASRATAGDSLAVLQRHLRALVPAIDFTLEASAGVACLTIHEPIAFGALRPFATEWWLAAFATLSRGLTGGSPRVLELRVAYPRPAHAERYRELFDVPMLFDQPASALRMTADSLDRRHIHSDPITARVAERSSVMTTPRQRCPDGLPDQVRRLLDASRGRPLRLPELARELQTSSRTLNRGLQGMGTSYRQLLDDSRRIRAVEWVRGSDMTTVQIASELGFSDVRGFRRAFKRWTGELPTAMRAARR